MGKKDKTKKANLSYKTEEQQEVLKFLILVTIIIVIVIGIYFLTRVFVTKDLKKDVTETAVTGTINYDVTIVGTILNIPYDEYYVVVYDSTSPSAGKYSGIVSAYVGKEDSIKVYTVDLSNDLNKDYYDKENSNPEAKTVSELKFGDITLIKVKKGEIKKYIEDYDAIKAELKLED